MPRLSVEPEKLELSDMASSKELAVVLDMVLDMVRWLLRPAEGVLRMVAASMILGRRGKY